MGWAMIIVGLMVALSASTLLLTGVIESGVATVMGILGIGLIAASGRWMPKKPGETPHEVPIAQTIFAPDRQLRALIKQRADGSYRVEVQKFVHDDSPDFGPYGRWERQPNFLVTDTLANAVEIAARSVGAGTDDFFGASEQ